MEAVVIFFFIAIALAVFSNPSLKKGLGHNNRWRSVAQLLQGVGVTPDRNGVAGRVRGLPVSVAPAIRPDGQRQMVYRLQYPPGPVLLRIRNETTADRLDSSGGDSPGVDIEVGNTEFDRTFWVNGHDPTQVRAVLNQDRQRVLVQLSRNVGALWITESEITATTSDTARPAEIVATVMQMAAAARVMAGGALPNAQSRPLGAGGSRPSDRSGHGRYQPQADAIGPMVDPSQASAGDSGGTGVERVDGKPPPVTVTTSFSDQALAHRRAAEAATPPQTTATSSPSLRPTSSLSSGLAVGSPQDLAELRARLAAGLRRVLNDRVSEVVSRSPNRGNEPERQAVPQAFGSSPAQSPGYVAAMPSAASPPYSEPAIPADTIASGGAAADGDAAIDTTTTAPVAQADQLAELFDPNRSGTLPEHLDGLSIRWTGQVVRVTNYRMDFDFPGGPGTKAIIAVGAVQSRFGSNIAIEAVLKLQEGAELERKSTISFQGRVVKVDTLLRNVFVSDVVVH